MASELPQLVKRLEAVTVKLESISMNAGSAASSSGAGPSSAMLAEFDELINSGPVKKLVDASARIGDVVKDQIELLKQSFVEQRRLLEIAAKSKKPDSTTFQKLLQPISEKLQQINEIREKNRPSPFFNHLSAISEGIPALGWPTVEPAPAPFIEGLKDSAQFYSNRVLKEFKDKEPVHKEFASAVNSLFDELQRYVKKHHTTGLAWNPKGESAPASAPAEPAPKPTATPAKPAAGGAMAGLFGELNRGTDVTSGLKKVEKSQMTHKNPALRGSSVVPAAGEKAPTAKPGVEKSAPKTVARGPAKTALEGNKWFIENHDQNKEIVIDEVNMKQGAYIYQCHNSVIQIKGKIGAVTIDGCKKTAVVVENVVSSLEIINCRSLQVQILGKSPTAIIDKTDGLNLFLSKECLDIEIVSAKSSELNVSIPPAVEGGDFIEKPIPEQFKTVIVNGSPVTNVVEHKG